MGVGNGLTSGLVLTLAADAAPGEQRGQFLGAFRLWADSGTLAGPLLVSAVAAVAALVPAVLVIGAVAWSPAPPCSAGCRGRALPDRRASGRDSVRR